MLKYLRLKIFHGLLGPFQRHARGKRGELFMRIMKPKAEMTILDIGGHPEIWDFVDIPLNITCLNLPGLGSTSYETHHKIKYVEGDGCHMPEFLDNEFDMVFSNSVIEHVGNSDRRKMFAEEVRRLSKNHWVQTPYKYFPIEAHCGMPFWWLYPKSLRDFFIRKWRKKLPAWTEMVETTTIVTDSELHDLFPDSTIIKEWVIFPKSLVAYLNSQSTAV